jgi:hypothetical protein
MRNVRDTLPAVSLCVAAALAAACDPSTRTAPSRHADAAAMPVDASNTPVAERRAATLATVEPARGGAVVFLDLGDGGVAVAERAPRRGRFAAMPLIEGLDATPLEVYLALAPRGAAVPDALVRDHRARAALAGVPGRAPRALDPAPAAAADVTEPGEGPNACDSFGGPWITEWKNAFAGITKYREAAYLHQYAATFTFYPGAPVYNGTNTNSKTYLGACNGDEVDTLVFEVHRRVGGVWFEVHEAEIGAYEKYTFYSGLPASYRGRTYGKGGSIVEHYGVGAAWTLSPPLGIAP